MDLSGEGVPEGGGGFVEVSVSLGSLGDGDENETGYDDGNVDVEDGAHDDYDNDDI